MNDQCHEHFKTGERSAHGRPRGHSRAVTVVSSGGWQGAGGATYTARKGETYGVFTGGGSDGATDVRACAWPSQPANPNCGGGSR
jgi:hypothetical protein